MSAGVVVLDHDPVARLTHKSEAVDPDKWVSPAPEPRQSPAMRAWDHPGLDVARSVAAVGLVQLAVIHLLDFPSKVHETRYVAILYLMLASVSLALVVTLINRSSAFIWAAVAVVPGATFLAYLASRTMGLPGERQDIGQWQEPLGIASLVVEATILLTAGCATWRSLRRPTNPAIGDGVLMDPRLTA